MKKKKAFIRIALITTGVLLSIQLPTFATTGKSTVSNLRIRNSASAESEVIDVLGLDEEVEILGEQGDWYNVSVRNNKGYASKTYISVNDDNSTSNTGNSGNTENNINSENAENNNSQNNANEQSNSETNASKSNSAENEQVTKSISNKIYKITEDTSVYILPVLTSEVIGGVKKDENVTLISNAGLWAYINTPSINGWVRIDKLSTENVNVNSNSNENTNNTENNESNTNNESNEQSNEQNNEQNNVNNTQETANNSQQSNYTPKTMYVKSSAINVRSQANTNSDIVTSIALNAEVKVVGEENGWYKVEINGYSGYIRNDLLSNEKTAETSRSNNVDRTNTSNNSNGSSVNVSTTNNSNLPSTTTTVNESVPVSSSGVTGNDIVAYAQKFLGCRYVYGASGPNSFDCSGLTMYVYAHFGYSLSHSSRVQATQGKAVTGELQPGDILVFTNGGSTVGHVGIYIGNDKFIHASDSKTGVIISNLSDRWNKSKYVGARRIL